MELRALRYFVTVAEELHFGRAAERLNIVQPAVSQQVARLERELGTRLLDRSSRHVRLTVAGRRVLDAARETLASADRVRAVVDEPATVVRIGSAPGLLGRLERGVEALRAHNPSFEAVLVDLPVAARLDALRRGELDLALVRGPVPPVGLRVLPAWSEPLHAVVAASHPLSGRSAVTLAEMADGRLRFPARECDTPLHDVVTAALADAGVEPFLGRRAGTVPDTIVEVGSDPGSWALLPPDQVALSGSTRVRAIPLDPPLAITGSVVAPAGTTGDCVGAVVDAFRDGTAG